MKRFYLLCLACMVFGGMAQASTDLSPCRFLIPNNHDYQVIVKYELNKNKETTRFVGITEKDKGELSPEQKKALQPFMACLKKQLDN